MKWRLLNSPNADIKKKADVSPRNAPSAVEKRPLRKNRRDWRTQDKTIETRADILNTKGRI
jgi:hypothetical protein